MDRMRRINCVALSFSLTYVFRYFLWGYVGEQVHSQRVNMLVELKARITAAIANANKGYVTVRPARGGLYVVCVQSYRWRSLRSVSYLINFPLVCKKKLFQLMNKILQTMYSYLFSFISYRCRHSFW
jgi:hypothetical protein